MRVWLEEEKIKTDDKVSRTLNHKHYQKRYWPAIRSFDAKSKCMFVWGEHWDKPPKTLQMK